MSEERVTHYASGVAQMEPTRPTISPNTGTASAKMNERAALAMINPLCRVSYACSREGRHMTYIQTVQCTIVLCVKCLELRSTRTKMYLADRWTLRIPVTSKPGKARP
jgi:hypothetical protein